MTQPQDKMRADIPMQMLQELFDAATDAGNLLFLPWRDVMEMRNETAERINAAIAAIRSLPCAQRSAQARQDALDAGKAQHARDSVELRNLCAARDDARRSRDMLTVENSGLTASVGHLSRMVDEQQATLIRAKETMTALHNSASPVDESRGDLDARIPASDFHKFVDEHAALIHAIAQSPIAIAAQGASNV